MAGVVVPIEPAMTWDMVHGHTRGIAEDLARLDRDHYTMRSARAGQSGKLFIDYLRNGV